MAFPLSAPFAALLACSAVAAPALLGAVSNADVVQVVSRVSAAESERESDIGKVICTRRYTLRNKRWDKDGVMQVVITSDSRTGRKEYQILSMQAEGLQKKVFLKVLEAEMDGSGRAGSEGDSSVTGSNYDFEFERMDTVNGKEYVVVKLKPKRSSKFLIAGTAWIDPKENAIVRVEGRTARSVSFWIGKPQIFQSFRKVDGVWVSATNRSVSDVKLLGETEMSVEFGDYKIVRQAPHVAATPSPRSQL